MRFMRGKVRLDLSLGDFRFLRLSFSWPIIAHYLSVFTTAYALTWRMAARHLEMCFVCPQ